MPLSIRNMCNIFLAHNVPCWMGDNLTVCRLMTETFSVPVIIINNNGLLVKSIDGDKPLPQHYPETLRQTGIILYSDCHSDCVSFSFFFLGDWALEHRHLRKGDGFTVDRSTRSQKRLGNVCSVKTMGTYRNKHKV